MQRTVLMTLLAAGLLPATAQVGDKILLDGKEHPLFENPLESFLRAKNQPWRFRFTNTANWRGYIATWTIHENRLYLTAITGEMCTAPQSCEKASLTRLFGSDDSRVFADWYTGTLRIPDGERLRYVHMGYGSVFERDILIRVVKGIIQSREVRTNPKPTAHPLELSRQELEKRK